MPAPGTVLTARNEGLPEADRTQERTQNMKSTRGVAGLAGLGILEIGRAHV